MLTYIEIYNRLKENMLNENYKNLINNIPDKQKYKTIVFNMIQKAYSKMGGIHGSGFESPDDMVKNIPFWKLYFKDNVLKFVIMYKDKNGRKSVATATDGTIEAKHELAKLLKETLNISFGERSGDLLNFMRKRIDSKILLQFAININDVKKILSDDKIYTLSEVKKIDKNNEDLSKIDKDDIFYDFYYGRKIGNIIHIKIMLGTTNKAIYSK